MYFGPLSKCLKCGQGQLKFEYVIKILEEKILTKIIKYLFFFKSDTSYICRWHHGWSKCNEKTQSPDRGFIFSIPSHIRRKYPFLAKFKFQRRDRLFEQTFEEMENVRAEEKIETQIKKPLSNMIFSCTESIDQDVLDFLLYSLGAVFTTKVNPLTVAVISNKGIYDF